MSLSPDISFEHFDPKLELGNFDINGKPIRPRKKPGRKPNPPSPAQRKAQNRAAQRAFRERKRREMREAEITVKHCLFIRDQALCEVKRLSDKVEEMKYENHYLKGQLLTYKLACVANRVDVPKFWDAGNQDGTGSDQMIFSGSDDIPQPLEIYLDKHRNIINFSQQHVASTLLSPSPSVISDTFECSPPSAMVNLHEHESLLSSSPTSSYSGSNDHDSFLNDDELTKSPSLPLVSTIDDDIPSPTSTSPHSTLSTTPSPPSLSPKDDGNTSIQQNMMDMQHQLSLIAPQLACHLDSPFFQRLLSVDVIGGLSTIANGGTIEGLDMLTTNSNNNDNDDNNNNEMENGIKNENYDDHDDNDGDFIPGVNQWLQQQNLHPRHLAAVSAAAKLLQNKSQQQQPEQTDDTEMMDVNEESSTWPTIKPELGSLDDNNNNDILGLNSIVNNISLPEVDLKTGIERVKSKDIDDDHLQQQSTSTTLLITDSKLKSAPPMKPLEALQYIRSVKNLNTSVKALFKPTELQRKIPHDARIDHVPSAIMRDLMILYQDFYNANELFKLLSESASFLGGEIGNPDCWFVPPSFIHQYWFLCPNHRPKKRMDNLVDIVVGMGQDMIKMMMERKSMYNDRDRYADYFPTINDSNNNNNNTQTNLSSPSSSEPYQQQQQDELMNHSLSFDGFSENDFPLNSFVAFDDISRLTSAVPSDIFAM
ncbi:hypothetical protein BJ944DRAFT_244344 [Cunninghamella echinulata]|nr:hypothetical protein BJ944DRAFT_244344 [Cunninghamella echinulata]